MSAQSYGSVPRSSPPASGVSNLKRAETLAFAVVGVAAVLLVATYSSLPGPVVLEASPAQKDLSQLDMQIKTDEALLKAQQSVVNKAESLLVKALNKKPVVTKTAKVYGDSSKTKQTAKQYATQHLAAGGSTWKEGDPGYSYSLSRAIALNGPQDDDPAVQSWNEHFNNLSEESADGRLIDNIDTTPCSVDCDKAGTSDDKDFAFYDRLLTTDADGHIVENLDDIDACTIDCGPPAAT